MPASLAQRLVGTWFRSHEEDVAGRLVFRPADYDFPPARGRVGYEFRPDRTGDYLGLASRDGWARSPFEWRLQRGARPALVIRFEDGREEVLGGISEEGGRLVVEGE
jgi:hypothetical protein